MPENDIFSKNDTVDKKSFLCGNLIWPSYKVVVGERNENICYNIEPSPQEECAGQAA